MSLTPEDVRAALNTWGAEKLLPLKGFGESLVYHTITESAAYRISLQTQYETRHFGNATVPAPSGAPVPRGPAPSKDFPASNEEDRAAIQQVTTARTFVKSSHRLVVDESHRVAKCTKCKGTGRATCIHCAGTKFVKCTFCGGTGRHFVWRNQTGNSGAGGYSSYEMCLHCQGGRVRCEQCKGAGQVTCGECASHGSVHVWDTVTHEFEYQRDDLYYNASELPDNIAQKAQGELIHNDFLSPQKPLPEMPPALLALCQETIPRQRNLALRTGKSYFSIFPLIASRCTTSCTHPENN